MGATTSASPAAGKLPEQWRLAYERDRLGLALGNDPAPERRAGRMLAAFILVGLGFLALPGTLLGVWNLLAIAGHRAGSAASAAWIQAHGQAQLFGWVGTFILGISLYVLPKFLGRSVARFGRAWAVWALWTAGVAWRWWAGVGARHWRVGLIASAALEMAAFLLAQYVLWIAGDSRQKGMAKSKWPVDLASWLGMVGFLSLGLALAVNLGIALQVARRASAPVYPAALDRMFLLIALWGFAAPVAWSYSARFVTIFLGLEKPAQAATAWLTGAVGATVVFALFHQFLLADLSALAATLGAAWTLRVFRPSLRLPKRIGVYSRYDTFVRLSYIWLIAGAVLGVLADLLPGQAGLGGASRHAVTVGFLATLIFCIGPRILPAFLQGRELWSPRVMAASLWLLSLGCLLRVSGESIAYSAGGLSWSLLPISAFLELTAVMLFVLNMGLTLSQPMPAWFSPSGVSAGMTVYFYVTSFPKTRQLLVEGGLKTLGEIGEPPRTLTLEEAAAADAADLEGLLARLRTFFAARQPRRLGRE